MKTDYHQQLTQLANKARHQHFRRSHADHNDFSVHAGSLWLNYSRNPISQSIMEALFNLARSSGLNAKINALFTGDIVNKSEGRAAKHTLLRAPRDDNNPDSIAVHRVLDKMAAFVKAIEKHQLVDGIAFKNLVCIGIGGSELGSRLVYEALTFGKKKRIDVHFVANIDAIAAADAMANANPETTLFLIISKTFTTFETSKNFDTFKKWFCQQGGFSETDFWARSAAITSNVAGARSAGIPEDHIFEFWPWVGGRYSLWSAVGLPIAVATGMDAFSALLAGANQMDEHFKNSAFEHNLPVILGLLHVWYGNYLQYPTRAVIPYAENLKTLPEHLQQLEMESLGKSVDENGKPIDWDTCPVVWGAVGSNAQHAFFQMLHQGTQIVPLDFIAAVKPVEGIMPGLKHTVEEHHRALLANCLAQSSSLQNGGDTGHNGHGHFAGYRPSNLLLLEQITPSSIGELIAAYEHKVLVQSVIWGINAFDQFGVELGKQMTYRILEKFGDKIDFEDIKDTFE